MRGSRAALEGAIALADPPATSPPSHAIRDDETLKLEEEVRALEREIARLEGSAGSVVKNNGSSPSVAPTSGPVQDEAKDGSVDQQAHQFIERLERQLVLTETRLKEADNERSQLRRLLEEHGAHPTRNTPTIGHPTRNTPALELMEQVQRAEAERDRLAALLATAEAESQSLQAQLAVTHQSLDTLSARVRRKLFEQKTRLDEAQQRIAMLSDELWRNRADIVKGRQEIVRKAAQAGPSA
ncbi:hypothetical protein Rt10032_c06g2799 [Rhodotorula toruloides]|uniref:Uncharacterized protein n=1 Tax=Rhodotorula toruloides TaxID=5286 RepID=A0A511KEM7_RHOTO|nr:hypothetical protein Rt10032_c06g2799 [Rhodotorula toruloides]